jgi:N utilization substance protein A
VRTAGILDGFEVSKADAEAMIMAARVKAGWIEAEAEVPTEDTDEERETEAQPS